MVKVVIWHNLNFVMRYKSKWLCIWMDIWDYDTGELKYKLVYVIFDGLRWWCGIVCRLLIWNIWRGRLCDRGERKKEKCKKKRKKFEINGIWFAFIMLIFVCMSLTRSLINAMDSYIIHWPFKPFVVDKYWWLVFSVFTNNRSLNSLFYQ